jgi:hypothetical protein
MTDYWATRRLEERMRKLREPHTRKRSSAAAKFPATKEQSMQQQPPFDPFGPKPTTPPKPARRRAPSPLARLGRRSHARRRGIVELDAEWTAPSLRHATTTRSHAITVPPSEDQRAPPAVVDPVG